MKIEQVRNDHTIGNILDEVCVFHKLTDCSFPPLEVLRALLARGLLNNARAGVNEIQCMQFQY